MVDEAEVRIKPETFEVGGETWVIARDDAQPCHVDLISEARHFNGTVYVSLAQSIVDNMARPKANIAARIRMNLATAQALHGLLGEMIKDATTPPAKKKAN